MLEVGLKAVGILGAAEAEVEMMEVVLVAQQTPPRQVVGRREVVTALEVRAREVEVATALATRAKAAAAVAVQMAVGC